MNRVSGCPEGCEISNMFGSSVSLDDQEVPLELEWKSPLCMAAYKREVSLTKNILLASVFLLKEMMQ